MFCRDERRDPSVLCVVQEAPDIVAVERTHEFRGRYHVLGRVRITVGSTSDAVLARLPVNRSGFYTAEEVAVELGRRRAASIALRLATAISQASGLRGTPSAGQCWSAAVKASDRASSAPATSRVREARKATSLP